MPADSSPASIPRIYAYVAVRDDEFLLLDWRDMPDEETRRRRAATFEKCGYRVEPLVLASSLSELCRQCNSLKRENDPVDWIARRFGPGRLAFVQSLRLSQAIAPPA